MNSTPSEEVEELFAAIDEQHPVVALAIVLFLPYVIAFACVYGELKNWWRAQ